MAGAAAVAAALLCALHVHAACQDATVTQELLQAGFHRELLVKVELGEGGEGARGCTVAARVRLPPGIYVDPYELSSLQRHNVTKSASPDVVCCRYVHTHGEPPRLRALMSSCGEAAERKTRKVNLHNEAVAVVVPAAVDVEAPEYSATELLVLLYMEVDPRCSRCFRAALPVHGRYHRPAEDSAEASAVLKSPEVLCCCCDNHLSTECWTPAEVEAPCSGKPDGPCQWYSTTHRPVPEELILQVPVGLRQHSSVVCVLTLLATGLCSSLILAAVCKHGHFSAVTSSE